MSNFNGDPYANMTQGELYIEIQKLKAQISRDQIFHRLDSEELERVQEQLKEAKQFAEHILLFLVEEKGYCTTFAGEKELIIKEARELIAKIE